MTASPLSSPVPEYRLEVGDALFALRCPQPGLAEGLAMWFDRPSVPAGAGEPVISLEITVIAHDDQPSFPRSLLTTKRLLGDGAFDISDGLITGRFDPLTGRGEVRVKAALLTGRLTRIFEQVLYQAHISARARMGRPAWLVHSSSVIVDGQGFLFVGPSGSGKSTVAANSPGRHVLGDEMSLVRPLAGGAGGWELVGTPFNGTFREKRPGSAPLRAVLLLEHGPAHELGDATESAAVAVLAGEIVPPVGLDEIPGPDTLPRMVDAAQAIAANTTLKVLRFTPDPGFWKTLEGAFGLPPLA
jgi:hypothetical protein